MRTSANRKEVAKETGVSPSTVSRALSNSPLIPEVTRQKVLAAAKKLNYIPNRQAGLFAQSKTFRLGLVIPFYKNIPPFSRAYFPALLNGIVSTAEALGYTITIITNPVDSNSKNLPDMVWAKEIDGLLLTIPRIGQRQVLECRDKEIPFVLINGREEGCYCVDGDPTLGMQKALRHIFDLGHSNIAYIAGDMRYINAIDRKAAFLSAAQDLNLKFEIKEGNFSRTGGYRCAGALLNSPNPPTAIFTSSDREALGVMDYCWEHGIKMPEELSVIGYDNLDPATYIYPGLSTVDNPITKCGEEAVNLLVKVLQKKQTSPLVKLLGTDFVARQSSGIFKNIK
jgi:LacI family transcriptional regulator